MEPPGFDPVGFEPVGLEPIGFEDDEPEPGSSDNAVLALVPSVVPVIVAVAGCVTGDVITANSARSRPTGTTASPITWAAGLFDASDTCAPPGAAGMPMAITPVTGPPPVCALGETLIDNAPDVPLPAGSARNVPLAEIWGFEAVAWMLVAVARLGVVKEKVPLVWPAAMLTVSGRSTPFSFALSARATS